MQPFPSFLLYPVMTVPINLIIYRINAPIPSVSKYVIDYDANSLTGMYYLSSDKSLYRLGGPA